MRKLGFWFAALLLGLIMFGGSCAKGPSRDEQEIRGLEDRFAAAVRAKDIDSIMKGYAPGAELFVFDVTPPRQHVGFDDYKKDWQDFFAVFPGPVDRTSASRRTVSWPTHIAFSR